MKKPGEIYQIKVTLNDARPPIWRRVLMKSDTTLAKLHRIIQRVMGWEDSHLHQFTIRGQRYGSHADDEEAQHQVGDERKYTLSALAVRGQFEYLYDFGDNWEHILEVERTCPLDKSVRYPVCVDGARACPPEDVGGIPGYESFLDAIKDFKHPEHEEYREWIGGDFDSETFDMNKVNRLLRALR